MPNFKAIGPAVTEKQQAEDLWHPPGSTRHVPQWVLAWFGIGPIRGRRDGGTHQRRPLVNRAFGSRDISLSKAWPRPAGRSYSGFSLILSRTRSAFGLARNKLTFTSGGIPACLWHLKCQGQPLQLSDAMQQNPADCSWRVRTESHF